MQLKQLGRTEVTLSSLGFGVYPLCDINHQTGRPRPTISAGISMIEQVLEDGVTFIDTANVYCKNESDIGYGERLVRDALKKISLTSPVTVATKGIHLRPHGGWDIDGRPEHIRSSCERSLIALGVEAITLYQLHAVDPRVPLLDTMGEIFRLQDEGKICHIGLSNVRPEEVEEVLAAGRIESIQNCLNPFYKRHLKNGLLDLCHRHQLTFFSYSPMGGISHREFSQHKVLTSIAAQYGVSTYQVALAWNRSLGSHVIPIPAATQPTSWQDTIAAINLSLNDEDIDTINSIVDQAHAYAV